MTQVYVTSGSSGNMYHTVKECYQLQKASKTVEKRLDHIQMFYQKCSVCSDWESEKNDTKE